MGNFRYIFLLEWMYVDHWDFKNTNTSYSSAKVPLLLKLKMIKYKVKAIIKTENFQEKNV